MFVKSIVVEHPTLEKQLALNVLEQGIVFLIALLFPKPSNPNKRLLLICSQAFLLANMLLTLPMYYSFFNLTGKGWNWSGKVYALLGSSLLYFLTRHEFRKNNFITFAQQPDSLKANLKVLSFILVTNVLSAWLTSDKKAFSPETLAFQLTMPGLEEELLFRGILLGLLSTIYIHPIRLNRWAIGYPALWLTATLFGLVHGLSLTEDWSLTMNWTYFWGTFLPGWLFGWMALKSRSILLPIIAHNLSNFCLVLIPMIK